MMALILLARQQDQEVQSSTPTSPWKSLPPEVWLV